MERDYLSSLLNLFRKRINKIFVGLLVIIIAACDFQSPSDFVVPTWFIDIKLPLVSKRFPMGDLVDTANFIYPTEDSAGFQILFTDLIDPPVSTEEMELGVRFPGGYMEQPIPAESIGNGPNASNVDIQLPDGLIPIDVTIPPLSPTYPETTLVFGVQSLFTLPIDSPKVMFGHQYNQYFVDPLNSLSELAFSGLNGQFPKNLHLDSLTAAITEPQITIDKLLISGSENTSYLRSRFENHGFPTPLSSCSAYFISIDSVNTLLKVSDTIANHFRLEVGNDPVNDTLFTAVFDTITDLSVGGLTDIVQIYT